MQGMEYFRSAYNLYDLVSPIVVAAVVSLNLVMAFDGEREPLISLSTRYFMSALAFLLLGFRSIYFLRMFRSTAKFVMVIESVFSDLSVFGFIFLLMVFMFSIPFALLSKGAGDNMYADKEFLRSSESVYLAGIGEYGTFMDGFETDPNAWFTRPLFLLTTMVIQVMMLNLIIGIIGATYERVISRDEEALYCLRARLIEGNLFLVADQSVGATALTKYAPYLMLVRELN